MTDTNSKKIIRLKNNSIELIVLPHIGGRIAALHRDNSKNILKSNSNLWNDTNKPELSAFSDFKAYNGHTVWVGPQSDWWRFQDLNERRKAEAAVWPPDPYTIFSEYTVVHQSPRSIRMMGVASPISHIRFDKDVAINDDGSIFLQTTITNTSSHEITWDIWFNTRLDGYCKTYVPFAQPEDVRVEPVLNDNSHEMPYSTEHNYFTYLPTVPDENFGERSSKTFIYPDKPFIAAFTDDSMLLIQFEKHKASEIHKEQALVEIYNHTEHYVNNALLELEYHSPYKTLQAHESFQAWEVWKVFPYKGSNNQESHISFLNEIIKTEFHNVEI